MRPGPRQLVQPGRVQGQLREGGRTWVRLLPRHQSLVTRRLFMEGQLRASLGTERSQTQALPPGELPVWAVADRGEEQTRARRSEL